MPDRIGNAAILWSATSDASGQRVHLLQAPLRQLRAGKSMQTFQRQSLDRSVLENVSVGDGSDELRGRVRYDHDAKSLSDALVAGSQGKTLRYIPDLSDPDVDFNCDLVAPLAPFGLELDQQRGILGDQSVELVLRLTTQGSLDPLYHGSAVLFSYRAGGSLEASSSFGRITSSSAPATFADIDSGGGFGSLSTALSNQGRIHWMAEESSVGPRTFPTLLLEDSRENLIDESEEFDQWTQLNAPALSSGVADPYGGNLAWNIGDDSVVNTERISETFTPPSTVQLATSLFVNEGSDNPVGAGSKVQILNVTATVTYGEGEIAWSSGEPTLNVNIGSTYAGPERWRDGWWRLQFLADGSTNVADVHAMVILPAPTATDIADLNIFGAQVE